MARLGITLDQENISWKPAQDWREDAVFRSRSVARHPRGGKGSLP